MLLVLQMLYRKTRITMDTMKDSELIHSLEKLNIVPFRSHSFDLRVDLNYRHLQRLPVQVCKMTDLQWLNLNVNRLCDLPKEITQLIKLRWLYLESNKFESFPAILCQVKSLVRLYFSSNSLTRLPADVRNLRFLRLLDLTDNNFSDFPAEICCSELQNLEKLFIDNNRLTFIPSEINELVKLQSLWLNDNQIEWLPQSLAELPLLQDLQIKNNRLYGLPAYLAPGLDKLTSIEWEGNRLTLALRGPISRGVKDLREYQIWAREMALSREMVEFRSNRDSHVERPCYRMRTRPRGVAVIIDNFPTEENHIDDNTDTDKLRSVLIKLGFNVRIMKGLMSLDIISALRFISLEDHRYVDCIVFVILSTGSSTLGNVRGNDSVKVDIRQLTDIFTATNCPTLAGKPKLFFLQILEDKTSTASPRGDNESTNKGASYKDKSISATVDLIPDEEDFLLTVAGIPHTMLLNSTVSVYSLYVTLLFDVLENYARKLNLLDLLATVHSQVKQIELTGTSETVHEKQARIIPFIQTSLRYNLYLSIYNSSRETPK
ncbi:caspase-8-like [Anneissia japonica]|uniref:caspase-8-like n=1 Tax=Anneissia japonica TaxID=1529436 RepID=UPI0014257E6A|nr:caspase-8-like [Anneissia japonica]